MTGHIRLLMKILVRESKKEVTTTTGRFWDVIVFLGNGGHHVAINTETKDLSNHTRSTWLNNNYS